MQDLLFSRTVVVICSYNQLKINNLIGHQFFCNTVELNVKNHVILRVLTVSTVTTIIGISNVFLLGVVHIELLVCTYIY